MVGSDRCVCCFAMRNAERTTFFDAAALGFTLGCCFDIANQRLEQVVCDVHYNQIRDCQRSLRSARSTPWAVTFCVYCKRVAVNLSELSELHSDDKTSG